MSAKPEEQPRTRTIPVASIALDLLNPRLDEQANQRDALRTIVGQQGDKIMNLAADIVREGVDPSSLAIVTKSEDDPATFVALEGNRRIAALKVLARPELVLDLLAEPGGKRLRALAQEFAKNPITEVSCVVFNEREAAHHWIELRHNGEQQGRGIVSWGAAEAARFEERRGRTSRSGPALQAVDLVRKMGGLADEELGRLHDVPITTVQRLLNDPYVRTRLGVEIDAGRLKSKLPEKEVVKGLARIIREAALGQLPVSRVDTKELRAKYIDKFPKNELPSPLVASSKVARSLGGDKSGASAAPSRQVARSQPPSRARNTVIPRACIIDIHDKKINNVYWELKRIQIDGRGAFPMAASVLFRVFLELSVDRYLRSHSLLTPKEAEQAKLKHKLQVVERHVEQSGRMTKNELRGARRAGDDNHFVAASISTLHAYVHDQHFAPSPSDLKAAWDTLEHFFKTISE
jgi:hypothetical protein